MFSNLNNNYLVYTLNLNNTISPSCITYSLPSERNKPFSFTAFIEPSFIKSSYETTSALINPLSISECIFPAACGAFVPFFIVQSLTSCSPAVKNYIKPKRS